jgi:hypothetical protein
MENKLAIRTEVIDYKYNQFNSKSLLPAN